VLVCGGHAKLFNDETADSTRALVFKLLAPELGHARGGGNQPLTDSINKSDASLLDATAPEGGLFDATGLDAGAVDAKELDASLVDATASDASDGQALTASDRYKQLVLADGPVTYFRFDDPVSNAGPIKLEDIGRGGVSKGFLEPGYQIRPNGLFGGALEVTDESAKPEAVFQTPLVLGPSSTKPVTLEMWLWIPSQALVTYAPIVFAGGNNEHIVWVYGDNAISAAREIPGGMASGGVSATIVKDAYTHVVFVYTGAEIEIYANGTKAGSKLAGPWGTLSSLGKVSIELYANGMRIDELAVYPSALSAERVLAHYRAGTAP
jgi:Concanavalin A-like lectin/glucanases superfamily